MIKIVEGNLLDADTKYIAHQANCLTRRSAHLAKAVFDRFPYADIYSTRRLGEKGEPGTIIIKGNGLDQRYVINMLAQYGPGKPKNPNSRVDGYDARRKYFYLCLRAIQKIEGLSSIAFPWGIGCGAAGGDWKFYNLVIEKFAASVDAEVIIVKLPE